MVVLVRLHYRAMSKCEGIKSLVVTQIKSVTFTSGKCHVDNGKV